MAQRQNEDGGDDGPGNFERRVSVGLRRQRVARLAAETDRDVEERAFHQHEYGNHCPEQDVEKQELLPRHRAIDAKGGLGSIGVASQGRQQQHAAQAARIAKGRQERRRVGESEALLIVKFPVSYGPEPSRMSDGESSSEKGSSPIVNPQILRLQPAVVCAKFH